jgi:hypothetical protein
VPIKHINNNINNNNNRSRSREVIANRSVIHVVITNEKEETSTLIDVAIPEDRNITQREAEKKINTRVYVWKYKEYGTCNARLYQ